MQVKVSELHGLLKYTSPLHMFTFPLPKIVQNKKGHEVGWSKKHMSFPGLQ